MNQTELVLSRDTRLRKQLAKHLDRGHELIHCDSLRTLETLLDSKPVRAVLVHMSKSTLGELSVGRFMSELTEVVKNAPIFALIDPTCSSRMRRLARNSADFVLPIPLDFARLQDALIRQSDVAEELEGFWKGMPHKELHGKSCSMVTFTPSMFEMIDELKVAARHDVTVLLVGETGSGKTYLARLIHELSARRGEQFCTVSCGALPPDLIESELFGYAKGAFTGADRDKEGKFSAAGRGTLLLDEIDVLPPEQQTKLLRVIETGEYEPVGSNETGRSNARLIVASNYDVDRLVQAGTFRTDLYYRLNILSFRLPPLRERPWDIEYLARRFALEHSRGHEIQLRKIESAFLDALRVYHWPGNIREMENVIRRAVLYCRRGVLSVNELPSQIRAAVGEAPAMVTAPGVIDANEGNGNGNHVENGRYFVNGRKDGNGGMDAKSQKPATLEARLHVLEQRIIEDSLCRNRHCRKETAAELGISRVTLYHKMKKFGLLT